MKKLSNTKKAANAISWIDRLPEFKQCIGKLGIDIDTENPSFCCLGVACVIAGIKEVNFDNDFNEGVVDYFGLFDGEGSTEIPLRDQGYTSLASLNDDYGYNFEDIASVLKNNPLCFFESKVAKKIEKHYASLQK